MTQQIGGYPPSTAAGTPTGQPTTQVAKDEAADVGRTAVDAGKQVAGTAAEQAANVAQEVKTQARDLVGEARGQVRQQASTGQQKAADGVRALGRELREMADSGQQSGPASEIARQAAARADGLASWLTEREPADLVEEVRTFARRRPGVFLLGMAVAGVVVGRLTRGAVDSARNDTPQRAYGQPEALYGRGYAEPVYGEPGYARTPAAPLPYDGPSGPGVPYDTPTPPQGQVAPRPYAPAPVADPLPPAAPAYDPDPFGAPADPAGRHASGGEYVDDLDRPVGRDDDPYRPGGDLR